MMYQTLVLVSLLLFALISESSALNLCNQQGLISQNITSYKYKNEKTQNCNCNFETSCIRKCCAVGFQLSKGTCLRNNDTNFVLNIPLYRGKDFVQNVSANNLILVGVMSCDFFPMFSLENNSKSLDWFYVQENGTLLTHWYGLLHNDVYCVDHFANKGLGALICYDTTKSTSSRINVAGMIISMPFLLATFIAYALLPDRNLHMKALMFYVITLMLSYLLLVIVQLSVSRFEDHICTLIGYFCLFFFLVSFFWMNVICIDIWFAFSGLRAFSGSKKIAERKRFSIYCVYAWGIPSLHVLIIYAIQSLSDTTKWYNPGIGEGQCFLKQNYPELLYFYGPMAVLIAINITLFAITAFKIRAVKKDTSMLKKEDSKRHSYENDKQTFNLYLKLLFAMGVNWSMEIISWAVIWARIAPPAIWYLTDFCNAIYGVFIFFIFVFKRSIWKLLKKRYHSFMGRSHLAHSMASTNATRTTSYSTANTMQENPHGGGIHDTSTLTSEA